MLRTFVDGLKSGLTRTEAARKAGYKNPAVKTWDLMRNPRVVAAMEEFWEIQREAEQKWQNRREL
jgi:phage terminase small subunit